MRPFSRYFVLAAALIASAFAAATDLKGRVLNGTTGKPVSNDEVVLLTLSQDGMKERAYTTSDHLGRFNLPVEDPRVTSLVRVVHQGVTYHKMAEPGARAFAIEVYDVAEKLEGVTAVMDVQRFEATSDTLEVRQLITVRNASLPPHTLSSDRGFEFQLPPQAQVQSGLVQVEEGQPLKQRPLAREHKGQYYFVFPLRPGDTRFAVIYQLPYNGEALIEPQLRNPEERFVVMLPKSMKFEPKATGIFQPMPGTTPDNVQGTAPIAPGQTIAFRISGTGTLDELQGRRQEAQDSKTESATRPGGGLGPPIEAPDPLQKYRWPILAGLAGLGGAGAVYVTKKAKLAGASNYPSATPNIPSRLVKRQSRVRTIHRHRQRTRA